MDDRRALMAAILANPDEDTPRLALADWLQEHGDEHGHGDDGRQRRGPADARPMRSSGASHPVNLHLRRGSPRRLAERQRWVAPRTRNAMLTSTAAKPTARARSTM